MKSCLVALALLLFTCVSNLTAQERKAVESTDLVNLKQVSDPEISPDGNLVAYVVVTPKPAGQHRNAHIWIVPTDGSTQARLFAYSSATDISPMWSPDGRSVAFLSDRENPSHGDPAFRFKVVGAEGRNDLATEE
jgi:Tol biopolymer transport system component